MKRIRKIEFINHPILNNLKLDFCDNDGNPLDTIILAGENGTGKTTILSEIHKISTWEINFEAIVELEIGNRPIKFHFYKYMIKFVQINVYSCLKCLFALSLRV